MKLSRQGLVSFLSLFSYARALEQVINRPRIAIAAVLVLTFFFGLQIPKLSFTTSIHDLVIETLPENHTYKAFNQTFGPGEIIRIVIKSNNVFAPETFTVIESLTGTALEIPGVKRVISLSTIKKAVDLSGKWDLHYFSSIVKNVALFDKNLISDNNKATSLTLVLKENADQNAVIDHIETMIQDHGKRTGLYQIGMPLISRALADMTKKDFLQLPPLTFVLIAALLFFLLKKPRYFILPVSCVTLSLVWTLGLTAIMGFHLSILTMIVPVFLIAVGTAYCLHIVSEYIHFTRICRTPKECVDCTFSAIAFPTVLAVMTTVIGLGSLLISKITLIREFSIITCLGMLSLFIILFTFLPPMLALIPVSGKTDGRKKRNKGIYNRFIRIIIKLDTRYKSVCLMLIALFTIFCIFGLFRLKSETNPVGYFKETTIVRQNFHDIAKDLSGSFPLYVVIKSKSEDFFLNPDHMAMIETLGRYLETLEGVDKAISFADYMKLVNFAVNQFDPQYYRLPEERFEVSMLINSYKSLLGRDLLKPFMDEGFSKSAILLLTHISSSKDFLDTQDKILNHVQTHFSKELEWDITGFGIVVSASSRELTNGQVKSLVLTLCLIFVIMTVLFLSAKVGFVAIIPNLFPIVVNFGLMGWLGIELSMATSLIAGIAIGLAVDDTIHYLARYNKEFRKDLDDRRALKETLTHMGRPIIITTIAISIGFSILMISGFKPTSTFGLMMVITMLSALVGDLIILPSLILHVDLITLWDLVRLKMGKAPRYGIPLFKGLSKTQVHYIIMAGSLKQIKPGELLFEKGESSDSMYAVISGSLDVIDHEKRFSPLKQGGTNRLVSQLVAGDIVGEMGLLRSAPRSATVAATESCELLQISWKMIQRLQWLYPPASHRFHLNLLNIISDRLDTATQKLYRESIMDELTGLCNKKGFLDVLAAQTGKTRRYNEPFALCLIKICHQGDCRRPDKKEEDLFLKKLGRAIYSATRSCDTLARVDADMFGLIAPRSSKAQTRQLCQRLHKVSADNGLKENGFSIITNFELSDGLQETDQTGAHMLDRLQNAF